MLFEATSDGMLLVAPDRIASDANPVACLLLGRTPAPNKTGVGRGANVKTIFSERMNKDTLTKSNVALYKDGAGTAIPAKATPSADGTSVTLNPYPGTTKLLAKQAWYMVVLWRDSAETGVQDEAGNLIDGTGKYTLSEDGRYVYFWFKTGVK